VGKSKHNKTLLRYKESKDRQHVSALANNGDEPPKDCNLYLEN